ncbi:MAG: GGDEF domain-containing protein [Deltaproteobacteria bacterium]|nr:GGDEF domain-containing protein [Deltaproteobacteria bacterium]
MLLLRSLLLLLVPGTLFSAALYLHLQGSISPAWQPLLALFPYLAVTAGLFLGWRFNRTRVLWIILLLILVERALMLATPFGREYLLLVAPLLVPLNLVFYSWWSERGLFTMHGLLRLMILLLQLGGVACVYFFWAGEVMAWLSRPLLISTFLEKAPFPQITMLIMFFSLITLLARFCKKPEALEGSFCWTLTAVVAGFWWPDHFAFWGGVAAFLLTIALIESSLKMAFNDELTGLPARRAMNEFLLKVGRHYTVAMVDVDHFKKVNDIHGHDVGDQVLRMVATCLRRVTGGGRTYRYGGEEFVVIFPNKDLDRALPHLEELRETVSRAEFTVRGRKRPKQKPEKPGNKSSGKATLRVTVSIGAATRNDKNTTPEQLIKAADKALYKAKKGGRNQVRTA